MAMGLLSGKRGNWQGRKDNSWLAQTGWNSALRPSANRRLHSFLRKPQLSPAFTPRPTAYVLAPYLLFPLRIGQMMAQAFLVGWFALLLGTAFIVLFVVRRSKARR